MTFLQIGSPVSVTPIKFGSLAAFTKSASHVIELVRWYTSALMVKWVFSSLPSVLSQWTFAFVTLLLSPVITSNEKRKELLIWKKRKKKKKKKHQLKTRCSCFLCNRTVQLQSGGSNAIPIWYSGLLLVEHLEAVFVSCGFRKRLSVTSNDCQVGDA